MADTLDEYNCWIDAYDPNDVKWLRDRRRSETISYGSD